MRGDRPDTPTAGGPRELERSNSTVDPQCAQAAENALQVSMVTMVSRHMRTGISFAAPNPISPK